MCLRVRLYIHPSGVTANLDIHRTFVFLDIQCMFEFFYGKRIQSSICLCIIIHSMYHADYMQRIQFHRHVLCLKMHRSFDV